MEAPPPYVPGKKKNNNLIIGLVIGGVLVCCGGGALLVVGAGVWGMKTIGPMAKCGEGLDNLAASMHAYLDDHNGKFPAAATWQDDIRPYYVKELAASAGKKNPFGEMPATGDWGCEIDSGKMTGFAYNSAIAGKKLTEITDKNTAMIFEVPKSGKNLAMKYTKQDVSLSPTLLNDHRGWMIAPIEGKVQMISKSGAKPFEIKTR